MTRYTVEELKELCDYSATHNKVMRLESADCSDLHLQGFNFAGARMTGANFSGSTLSGANFKNATLDGVNFSAANLTGADFTDAYMEGAVLTSAKCRDANFSYVDCDSVDFTDADMRDTDMTGASLNGANFIILLLPRWTVHVHADTIRIGCQHYKHDEWENFMAHDIDDMAPGAWNWWTTFKPVIMAAAKCVCIRPQ